MPSAHHDIAPYALCQHCTQPLYGWVAFCPFCGHSTPTVASQNLAPEKEAVDAVTTGVIAEKSVQVPVVTPPAAAPTAEPTAPAEPAAAPPAPQLQTKPAATTPATAATGTAPVVAASPTQPQASGNSAARSSGAGKTWGIAAAVLLAAGMGGWQWSAHTPQAPDACDQALGQAQTAMANAIDPVALEQLARTATELCPDPQRAEQARGLRNTAATLVRQQQVAQAQAQKQAAQKAARCAQNYQKVVGIWQARRLSSAEQALAAFQSDCPGSPDRQNLATQIAQAADQAQQASITAQQALNTGNHALAEQQITQLARINQEHPDLPALRNQLQQMAVPVRPAAPAANTQALVQDFLKDAQTHLQRNQYDKAKAFVESAQRIDPQSPEAARLKRRIQEQEMQYLRQNITID